MTENTTLMEFPCHFPLKIIGKKTEQFANEIIKIIRNHFPNTPDEAIQFQESKQANFLSITATIYATNQPELDALYNDLTKHPDIRMVL